jgi:hypothetical protein
MSFSMCRQALSSAGRITIASCLCAALISCGGAGSGATPPTVHFTAPAPGASITRGQSVSLAWTSNGASGCTASDSNTAAPASEPVNGTATVTPTAAGSFTYTIACTGAGGTATASVTVNVVPPPQPKVTVTVQAQETTVMLGDPVAVSWRSTNATSCVGSTSSIFSGSFNANAYTANGTPTTTSGTYTVVPIGTGSFTYTVACAGANGTASANASVVVAPDPGAAPITITSPVRGETIVIGQSVTVAGQGPPNSLCFVITGPNFETGFGSSSVAVTVTPETTGTVTYGVTCSISGGPTSFAMAPAVTVMPDLVAAGKISTLGSTSDPVLHDMHPEGLTLATTTAGLITAGDLLTCDYADSGGNAGQGMTIVGLHPVAGATAYRVAQSTELTGCNALAALPDGTLFAAAYSANQMPMITPAGRVNAALPAGTFIGPSGIAYAGNSLYVAGIDLSRPDGGSIYRVALNGDTASSSSVVQIVSGLCTSGTASALYGPVALVYGSGDTLYIADSSSGQVVEIREVASFSAAGQFAATCGGSPPTVLTKIEGTPQEDDIGFFGGAALALTPVGIALLPNGNLLVANGDLPLSPGSTPPPANSVIEISSATGGVLGQPRQLDTGAPGALSSIVATQDRQGNEVIYFTNANTNSILMLSQ